MIRSLLAGAMALAGAVPLLASSASAQVPPLVWDGVVIPDSNCLSSGPVAWRATYRPYISDAVSGAGQPSQLVVFTDFQRNDYGLRLPGGNTSQFSGSGGAIRFFIGTELNDLSQGNTGNPTPNASYNFSQSPAKVKANTAFVKITGTITVNGGPGLACATTIRGVFVRRGQPTS